MKIIALLICAFNLLPVYAQDSKANTESKKAKVDLKQITEEITFDFKNNLNLAHFYREGLIIDPTRQSVIKYLRDDQKNWAYGHVKDGRNVMMPKGVQARFWIPITPEFRGLDLQLEVILKPADASQKVDLFFDDTKISHEVYKTDEWSHKVYQIPASLTKEGLHLIKFHFSKRFKHDDVEFPAWFRLLRISAKNTKPLADVETELTNYINVDALYRNEIKLLPLQSLEYYLNPPKQGVLTGQVKGGEIELFSQQKVGDVSKSLGVFKDKIDLKLDIFKGNATRLVVKHLKGEPVISAQIAPTAITANEVTTPKYVVFWLVDTLRADKLPFYQMKNSNQRAKVKTPHLTAFSKEASIFEPFYVQGNESKASHASLFSGTYPVRHKVYDHDAKLADEYTTIAEAFLAQKYKTAGFVANGYISEKWGYTQGFEFFENYIRENRPNNAAYINKQTFEWINKLPEIKDPKTKTSSKTPFYAYLGTSDPHVSYRVHEEYMKDYDTEEYDGLFKNNVSGEELEEIKSKKKKISARDKIRIEAMYENEIAYNDAQFGKLVEYLKSKKIYDETLIVVTADHGEEFWEHGSCGHGHSLYQELVAVPLLIKWPKNFPAKRIDMGVDGTDLLPTLMEMIGATIPATVQGRSIVPYLNAQNVYPQAILASKGNEKYTIQIGQTKVIYQSAESINAYHLGNDVKEASNLADQHYILTLSGLDPMLLYLSRPRAWQKRSWGVPNVLSKKYPLAFPESWKK
jgi:arylsulfatase A-like enzyme